jgi:diguanylate cyclase (GGDEF)-like protein
LKRSGGTADRAVAVGMLAMLVSSLAVSAALLADAGREVRVGVYSNPPKIDIEDGSGSGAANRAGASGLFAKLLGEIARLEGWRLLYVPCDWADCLVKLEAGQLDLMPDVAFTPARIERFGFHDIAAVASWSQVFALPQEHLNSPRALNGMRVALLDGGVQQEWMERLRAEDGVAMDLVVFPRIEEAFAAVAGGRADAVITNHFAGQHFAPRYGLMETPVTFDQVNLYFAAPDPASPLLPVIDRYLLAWKRDPESVYYAALARASAAPAEVRLPRWVLSVLPVLVLLAVAFAFLARWLNGRVRLATRELRQHTDELENLLAMAPVVLYRLSAPDLRAEWVSANIKTMTGFTATDAQVEGWWLARIHPDDRERVARDNRALLEQGRMSSEYRVFDRRGRTLHVLDEKRFVATAPGQRSGMIYGSWSDLTRTREQQHRLDFLQHHDLLTRLPNREQLLALTRRRIDSGQAGCGTHAFVVLDLDRFRTINQAMGTAVGDRILCQIANRLREWAADDDLLARIGNDEFGLLLSAADPARLEAALNGLLVMLGAPMRFGGHGLSVTVSVGMTLLGPDGSDADQLLQQAGQALDSARAAGGNRWVQYQPGLGDDAGRRLLLEQELRHAILNQQLELHFQPQFRLDTGQLVGVEALVRWQHPERGLVAPAEFIPLAEQIGLIGEIDAWVVAAACLQYRAWQDGGFDPGRVSVNLSPVQLYREDWPDHVTACLERAGMPPERLLVELTETSLMQNPELGNQVLRRLGEAGVGVAMDDFGTGYSNLVHLNQLSIVQLKLDRSLVIDIEHSGRARKLVRLVLAMAAGLEIETVAEGIETEGQRELLRSYGCSLGQGYLLGRPMLPDRLPAAVRNAV